MVAFVSCWFALGEGRADASQTEDTTNGCCRDGFEGLAAGSTGGQGFGQVVKAGRVHLSFVLSRGSDAPGAEKITHKVRTMQVNET